MAMTGGGGSIAGQDHGLLSGLTDDDHTQYLRLLGRTNGQIVGSGAHTGGNTTDIVIEGRLLLGDALTGVNFTAGRQLQVTGNLLNASTLVSLSPVLSGLTGTASGTAVFFSIFPSGTIGYTGGSCSIRGFQFIPNFAAPAGVTFTEVLGALFQPSISNESATGHVGTLYGIKAYGYGCLVGASTTVATIYAAIDAAINPRNKSVENVYILKTTSLSGTLSGLITNFFGVSIISTILNSANVTNWYGIYVEIPTLPTYRYGIYQKNTTGTNRLEADTMVGALTVPNSTVHNDGNQSLKLVGPKTAAYTAARETFITCDANTVGAFAVTLPTAVGILGRIYVIKKVDASANAVTVQCTGAETIDGAATVVLNAQWQVVRVVSDGANWLTW